MAGSLDNLLEKARRALLSDRAHIAASHYRNLIRRDRRNPIYLLEGTRAFTHIGDVSAAREALRAAQKLNSPDLATRIHIASAYFKLGDYPKSHDLLSALWKTKPNPEVGAALIEVSERLGFTEEALTLTETLGTAHPRIRLLKGLLLSHSGEIEAAKTTLAPLVDGPQAGMDPTTSFRAGLVLADCLDRLGRYPEAWKMMLKTRKRALPPAQTLQVMEAAYQKHLEKVSWIYDDFRFSGPSGGKPDSQSPHLLAGHPRSGNSVIAVHLAAELGKVDLDEVGGFMRSLENLKLTKKRPHQLRDTDLTQLRSTYCAQMKAFAPGLSEKRPWLDKNPGLESHAPYWLTAFPDSRVSLVRRDPTSCLISCLFTYLPLNPFSLQFFSVQGAANSIKRSLECQERLLEAAGDSVDVIHYEDFIKQGLTRQVSSEKKATLNSPNYAQAHQALHSNRINRADHYREFLPPGIFA